MSIKQNILIMAGLLLLVQQSAYSADPLDKESLTPPQDIAKTTRCVGEENVWDKNIDNDVIIKPDSNLTVMFHGNRFPASKDLVAAFERANPDIKVSYSSLPPASVLHKLINIDLTRTPAQKDILSKMEGLKYPDVVMVPEANIRQALPVNGKIAPNAANSLVATLIDPKLYSKIKGIVAVMRSDETRIQKQKDLKTTSATFVFAGQQSQKNHAIFKVPSKFFGENLFEQIKMRDSTGYSQMIHHRSIPARILTKCEDVGFQFAQSQPYLENRFPGKFKFLDLPVKNSDILSGENSYVAVTKNSTHKEAAEKFVAFIMGSEGQGILKRYKMDLESSHE